jgi:hypothetical protein
MKIEGNGLALRGGWPIFEMILSETTTGDVMHIRRVN